MTGNKELYSAVSPYLHAGEEVLWLGKPGTARTSGTAVFSVVFSLFFMGFSVFWMLLASLAGGFFFLFGLPFFLVGAFLLYSATLGRKRILQRTVYAVTDTRAIIIVDRARTGTSCAEYVFSNLSSIDLENVRDGVGTIRFARTVVNAYGGVRYGRRSASYEPEREFTTAFLMIDDVHSVYHLISDRLGR